MLRRLLFFSLLFGCRIKIINKDIAIFYGKMGKHSDISRDGKRLLPSMDSKRHHKCVADLWRMGGGVGVEASSIRIPQAHTPSQDSLGKIQRRCCFSPVFCVAVVLLRSKRPKRGAPTVNMVNKDKKLIS